MEGTHAGNWFGFHIKHKQLSTILKPISHCVFLSCRTRLTLQRAPLFFFQQHHPFFCINGHPGVHGGDVRLSADQRRRQGGANRVQEVLEGWAAGVRQELGFDVARCSFSFLFHQGAAVCPAVAAVSSLTLKRSTVCIIMLICHQHLLVSKLSVGNSRECNNVTCICYQKNYLVPFSCFCFVHFHLNCVLYM